MLKEQVANSWEEWDEVDEVVVLVPVHDLVSYDFSFFRESHLNVPDSTSFYLLRYVECLVACVSQ